MTPLLLAAYKCCNRSIETLIDVMKCNVNAVSFDGSNALIWVMVSDGPLETLQMLIDRGCKVNHQIYSGPGWQSNMTMFAGFSPLMFAVNRNNIEYVRLLLAAGADPELRSSPIVPDFPISTQNLFRVYEYEWNGFEFNALHIAAAMDEAGIVNELLVAGKADVDARVYAHKESSFAQYRAQNGNGHPLSTDAAKELTHALKSPLHLLEPDSDAARHLVLSGASLLAQDIDATCRITPPCYLGGVARK